MGRAAERVGVGGFEIGYVTDDGLEHRVSLSQAWATPFESCRPIRRFTSHKGQRHLSGLWWSATAGGHVGFESWMERDHVMALDFDPTVVGIASQPFWLSWRDQAGKLISHAPDFFARRADGTSVVVDCRPVERRKPRDAAKFEATARACDRDSVRDLRCRRRGGAVVTVAGINALEAIADEPLTTKEGWRRFVDRQPHPPVLLGAVRLAKLSERDRAAYDDGRRGYHADLPLVSTPIIRKVISTSRLLVQLNRNQVSARRGVIISGASGTGKTTALTQLGRTHELHTRKRYPADRHRLPVLYVTVPPAATARMLAVEFARFLGLEFTGRANITDIVNAVCATAAHTRVELVCVDELHNLNLATRAGAEVSDQLKYFAERLPATFVYAGIDVEAQGLFAGVRGRQIAGRFTVIPAAPFAYGTGAQREQWQALIATLESLLRLHRHRTGNLARLEEYLYRRSGGMIGSLSQLVRGAAILAIEDGSEQISKQLLDSVAVDYAAERADTASRPPRLGSRAIRKQTG